MIDKKNSMEKRILDQLKRIAPDVKHSVDGVEDSDDFEHAQTIIFHKKQSMQGKEEVNKESKFVFADYMLRADFGFNTERNNGRPPIEKTLWGVITQETTGMVYILAHSRITGNRWEGWCPKKSVEITPPSGSQITFRTP